MPVTSRLVQIPSSRFPLPVIRLPLADLYRGRLERRMSIDRRSFFAYRGISREMRYDYYRAMGIPNVVGFLWLELDIDAVTTARARRNAPGDSP